MRSTNNDELIVVLVIREHNTLNIKTDEQISPVNGLDSHEIIPTDSNRLRWRIRFSEKENFELTVKK